MLKSVHPSPLSASRGFFDCGHFRKANEWLGARYGPEGEIDWNLNDDGIPTTSAAEKKAAEKEVKTKGDVVEEVTPVVAVGEVTGAEEESKILEKQGEGGMKGE